MFTGIVEEIGVVKALESGLAGTRLTILASTVMETLTVGASVSVNGACLTVVAVGDREFSAEVSHETLSVTALVSHQAVAEAAVIGKPHKTAGEAIKAFVILKHGQQGNSELIQALKDQVKKELGKIAVPQEIDLVTSLPKTRSGKIMRRVLKAKELGQDPGDISTLEE